MNCCDIDNIPGCIIWSCCHFIETFKAAKMFSLFVFMDCIRKYKCAFSYFPIFISQTEINGPDKILFCRTVTFRILFNRCTVLLGFNRSYNTRIYNLISVPQITRLLSWDAIISSKTDPQNGSKKEKKSYGKLKIKPCQKSWHLFEFFILNNKVVFCDAFLVLNLKKSFI